MSGALLYFAAVSGAWAEFLVEPNRSDQALTMEIYAKASSKATQEALRRLGSGSE